MNVRKISYSLIAALIVVTTLAGCDVTPGYNVKQTNLELSVMIDGMADFELNNITKAFETAYPNIKLVNHYPAGIYESNLTQEDREALIEKTSAEILAGRGPDIFIINKYHPYFYDTEKSMKSGAFYDLNNLLKDNKNYNRDNYIEGALKAGEHDGGLYILPVSVDAPIWVTTKEIMDDTGIDLNKCKDYFSFMGELDKYHESTGVGNQRASIAPLYDFNLELLNAYENTVTYNTDAVKQAIETYKTCEKNSGMFPKTSQVEDSHIGLFNYNKIVFSDAYFGFKALELSARLNEKFEPILLPKYNSRGQIQAAVSCGLAVNPNSPNMDNVAKFIDLVLTHDAQSNYLDNPKLKDFPGYNGEYDNIPEEDRYKYASLRNTVPADKSRISKELALREKQYNDGYIYNNSEMEKSLKVTPLSSDYYTQFYDICENIEVCTLPTGVPAQIYNYFLPYFKDEITLDEAIQTAQSAMEIYISE